MVGFSFDHDLARGGREQAVHQLERRRLATAGFAEQDKRFAVLNLQTQTIDDRPAAVDGETHFAEFDERCVIVLFGGVIIIVYRNMQF